MKTMSNRGDVIDFLKSQHDEIKSLFVRTAEAAGEERKKLFQQLRRLLAVHETAEEEIVHPAARHAGPEGEAIVDARLEEENEAKMTLADLEELDTESEEFDELLGELEDSVVAHAESEETEEFALLAEELDPTRLERMRKAAEFAESVAPTRPHPGIESAVGNLLVGPFASMLDRSRDALSGKS